MRLLYQVLGSLLILVMLAACGGIPKEAKERAKALTELSKKTVTFITEKKTAYQKMQTGNEAQFVGPYAKKEEWINKFNEAMQSVKSADALIAQKIQPLLKRNEEAELSALYTYIGKGNKLLREAKTAANYPANRAKFLLNAKKNSSAWLAKAKSEVNTIDKLVEVARLKSEQAKVDAKKYSWSKTDKELDQVFHTVKIDADKAHQALKTMDGEIQKSFNVDYAKLGDSATAITTLYKSVQKKQPAFLKKTDELYRSYAKTLEDMKIEYYVVLERLSWDNFYDLPTETPRKFISRPVVEEVYNYFDTLSDGNVAHMGGSFSRFSTIKVSVNKTMFNALGINLLQNPISGDDEADVYVINTFAKYYHKQAISENEKEVESDWVAVNENFYWAHEEHLGMTIYSKPYGMYESEAIKDSVPKGMQYIAKPRMVNGKPVGENKYGKWETNSSGHSFFHYYGMYHALFGGNTYGYNDYGGYRSRSGSYYGNGDRFGTYGSATYRDGSRYGRSNYAKRNAGSVREAQASKATRATKATRTRSTGRAQKASVRGAGSSSRGRGASGKGGK